MDGAVIEGPTPGGPDALGLVLRTGRLVRGGSGPEADGNSSSPEDLAASVRAAAAGSREAFTRLYRQFAPMVHGILLARTPRSDVDDLVQDVFLSAWRRLDSLREPEAFGGWIASIARNRAASRGRELAAAPRPAADGESAVASGPRADGLAEARAALEEIARLPDAYRETLVLRLVEGMTGPEIAEKTGLTPGSVRVNLHRGMALLRERLRTGDDRV